MPLKDTSHFGIMLRNVGPQMGAIALNPRRESQVYYKPSQAGGVSILTDPFDRMAGPLSGMAAGLAWLTMFADECEWLETFPSGSPEAIQSLCALCPRGSLKSLRAGIKEGRFRNLCRTLEALDCVQYPVHGDHSFLNIDTPEDHAEAERLAMQSGRLVSI